jgi:hypothetical protein
MVSDRLQEFIGGNSYATDTLYAFDDHRGDLITFFFEMIFQCLDVVEGKKSDVGCFIDRRDVVFVVGGGNCQGGSTVKGTFEGDYFFSIGVKAGEFQRILIGFGAAVAKEELVIQFAADGSQFFCQCFLQGNVYGVRVKGDLMQLLLDSFDPHGVTMTDADDGMSTVQI